MDIVKGVKNFPKDSYPNLIMGIGNFDGVHRGHQLVIKKITARAKAVKGTSLIFTFPVHPLNVLRKMGLLPELTTLSQKLNLLSCMGVNVCLLVDFNQEFARLSPFEFVGKIIKEALAVKEIFVGENYHFGNRKTGNVTSLKKWQKMAGFKVKTMPLLRLKDGIVTSTRIRELLKAGNVETASSLLGRPYTISGGVVKGSKRGVFLGFPTANIHPGLDIVIKDGVYAGEIEKNGKSYQALVNLGRRPTFNEHKKVLEVYMFNYSGSLYGQELCVRILYRLRDELKFSSPRTLIKQIKKDIRKAKDYFKEIS